MMTPVEIIGLVSAVITFIDFAAENIAIAQEIDKSGAAATKENAELENRINLLHEQVEYVRQSTKASQNDIHGIELLNLTDEYKDLTIRLLGLLGGLKSTKKRHVIWKSVKNVYKKNEKEALQRGLQDCLLRIQVQLMQVTRYEFAARLDGVSDQGRKQMEELQRLRKSTAVLEGSIKSWGHIPSLLEQVRLIVHESKTALGREAYFKIMNGLKVKGMVNRFDEVDEAHEHTFGWILESGPAPETETAEEFQARQGIIDWLSHGNGVFHITGKPGAGKSTLMKYLCQNPKTQDYLNSWAGQKSRITTNFFFWRLGSDIQKSLDGLRRALLYSILQGLPGFTEHIFPRHWKSVFDDRLVSIHTKDVDTALEALFNQTDFLLSHRLVFFIDGLDEYDGDHDKMLKTILKWTKEHRSDIKLCVSSREWEIFAQRLADCPRIKLQEITRRDMQTYVNEELYDNEEFTQVSLRSPEILNLAEIITEKAEGVFLWVKITLRSLRWGLLSGESVKELEARISALPNELEALYQSIFDSIRNSGHTSQIDKMRAMRTILTVSRYAISEQESGTFWPSLFQVPLMYYSFIDEYERDKDFAINMQVREMEESVQRERIEKARRMIYQRCMGLLETYTVPSDDIPRHYHPKSGIPLTPITSQQTATATTKEASGSVEDEDGFSSDVESSCPSSSTASFAGSIISREENDEFLHEHAEFWDDGKFNHRFMYQPRCMSFSPDRTSKNSRVLMRETSMNRTFTFRDS
ncbi:P-loop containing nucleoside triphosphate hydrolase [Colletotrichum asianum]